MAYLRFVVADPHPDTGVAAGIFTVAYALRDAGDTSSADRSALANLLMWFKKNLPIPNRFNRSTSKGYYRKNTKGIAWFRDDAHEYISRMHALKAILESNGHIVRLVQEDRIGYIVYNDDAQVVAEPFADTRTDD